MNINERQNSDLNLKRLAAQRQLYSEAKKLVVVQFILSGLFVVALSIVGNIFDAKFLPYIILAAIVIIFLDELILSDRIYGIRVDAARIQEEFDCDVLQLPQNNIKITNGSMLEMIQVKARKYISKHHNYNDLLCWYPGIDETDNKYYRLICQATNCWWNQALRKKYSEFILIVISIIFVALIVISLIKGFTVATFLMAVVSPILPAFVLFYKINRDNSKAVNNLNHMKGKIDEIILKAKSGNFYSEEDLISDSRRLQDMIFDNRSLSPLIPDRLYFKHINQYEMDAQETNKELIRTIRQL